MCGRRLLHRGTHGSRAAGTPFSQSSTVPAERRTGRVNAARFELQQTRALVGLRPDRQPVRSPKTSLPQAGNTNRMLPTSIPQCRFGSTNSPYNADIVAALDLNLRLNAPAQYCTVVPWDRRKERPLRRLACSATSPLARWSPGHLGGWSTRRLERWQVCHPTPSERAPSLSQGFRPARRPSG